MVAFPCVLEMTAKSCEALFRGYKKKNPCQVRVCIKKWSWSLSFGKLHTMDVRAPATALIPTEPSRNGFKSPFSSPETETCKNPKQSD